MAALREDMRLVGVRDEDAEDRERWRLMERKKQNNSGNWKIRTIPTINLCSKPLWHRSKKPFKISFHCYQD